jgi:hypothetical protein
LILNGRGNRFLRKDCHRVELGAEVGRQKGREFDFGDWDLIIPRARQAVEFDPVILDAFDTSWHEHTQERPRPAMGCLPHILAGIPMRQFPEIEHERMGFRNR